MQNSVRRHHIDLQDDPILPVSKRGKALLSDPLLNKGTGFPDSERDALGIRGLVPPQVVSIDDQVQRVMENFYRKDNDLERYIHLEALHDRNETLYYRVLLQYIRELTPIVYTPTVGKACQHFGHIYRRARGMYFSAGELPYFSKMVHNWPQAEVDVIVVTDGSRILGLGDLGANGMGIPIGKLSLYVVGAGVYPCKTLPVLLDVGTDNAALRDDPLYLGERIPRLRDEAFFQVMEAFVTAVHTRWPEALIQFEDFSNNHAFLLLERYRDRVSCFNDDIQGTGAVTLAGLLSALRFSGEPLGAQRVLFFGAGSAARGIADTIVAAAMSQDGLDLDTARRLVWMMDSEGLVTRERLDRLAPHKRDFAHAALPTHDLLDVIRQVKPTVLIGVSKQPGAFTEQVIQEMHKHTRRPIIFPLSNPTTKAECTAEQAYHWTQGAALFASGSPFEPVTIGGRIFVPGQCNNMYIFPGVGMGAFTFRIRKITDQMFYTAARTLADQVGEESLAVGRLFPDLGAIRELSAQIAVAVGEVAFAEGLTRMERPPDLLTYVKRRMFYPSYVPYEAV